MRNKLETSNMNYENAASYPFIVSDRDSNGKVQLSRVITKPHGFEILTDGSMFSKLFNHDDNGGVKIGTRVYEIRVKNNSGEWQDWQAFVGNIQIVALLDEKPGKNIEEVFKKCKKKFQDNFEIRYSGLLFRSIFCKVTILDEKLKLIKTVDPFTLKIEYQTDLDNNCYPFKKQIKDQKKFKKKYYAYDENWNRL